MCVEQRVNAISSAKKLQSAYALTIVSTFYPLWLEFIVHQAALEFGRAFQQSAIAWCVNGRAVDFFYP